MYRAICRLGKARASINLAVSNGPSKCLSSYKALDDHANVKRPNETADSNNSTKLTNQASFRPSNDRSTAAKRIDEIMDGVYNLPALLYRIKPHLNEVGPDELEHIVDKITKLTFIIKNQKAEYPFKPYENVATTIRISPEFGTLVDRTVDLIDELTTGHLLKAFKLFDLIGSGRNDRVMKHIIGKLERKLDNDELSLNEITIFYKMASSFNRRISHRTVDHTIRNLMDKLLKSTRSKLLNNQFDTNDIELLDRCFYIFSRLYDDVTEEFKHLIKLLLSPEIEFEYRPSIIILRSIKGALVHFHRDLSADDLNFGELIDKCNSTIYKRLSQEPTTENAFFYTVSLHRFRDIVDFKLENYYDPRILALISTIITKSDKIRLQEQFLLYRLLINYSRFNIYDESLLKYFYELVVSQPKFTSKLGTNSLFNLFSKYRLPFVDYQRLANLLFKEDSFKLEQDVLKANTAFKLFCNVILSDAVTGEHLHKRFDYLIKDRFKTREDGEPFYFDELNLLVLAKVYLTLFGETTANLRSKVERTLDELILRLSRVVEQPLHNEYFKVNNKLSKNVYLSNGLCIGSIAIYDKRIEGLISSDEYRNYSDKIDKLPLEEHHQM